MSPDLEHPSSPITAHQGTVLVVDDAPDTLRMLCDALAREGYTVLVARDGHQALARLDVALPDAILLDGVMPGLGLVAVPRDQHGVALAGQGIAQHAQGVGRIVNHQHGALVRRGGVKVEVHRPCPL